MRFAILLFVFGCSKGPSTAPNPDPSVGSSPAPGDLPGPVEQPVPAPGDPGAAGEAPTPASLYAACRDRVEQPETDGECTTNADCGAFGCSGETCTTVAEGTGMMSTCDLRECFGVLEACGCVEGRCAWSLKAEVTPGARKPPPRPTPPGVPPIPTGPQ